MFSDMKRWWTAEGQGDFSAMALIFMLLQVSEVFSWAPIKLLSSFLPVSLSLRDWTISLFHVDFFYYVFSTLHSPGILKFSLHLILTWSCILKHSTLVLSICARLHRFLSRFLYILFLEFQIQLLSFLTLWIVLPPFFGMVVRVIYCCRRKKSLRVWI